MKSAVFIVCLIGMSCTLTVLNADSSHQHSSESHSKSISDSHPDSSSSSSSSSSEERSRTAPTVNGPTVQSIVTEDFARGDSFRRRRAIKMSSESSHQDTNSIESHSTSKSDSHSDSSSEEVSVAPTPDGATPAQTRSNSLRRRRALNLIAHGSSSHHSEESVTTESTSHQSHPESSEESHESTSKTNLLQAILGTPTVDPDTSEESSEERTTPVFQP